MPDATRRAWGSLDRDQIVDAAIEIARREGVEAVSIRRVAARVGAGRMALYRHVPDKETLLDLVANAIAERDVIVPAARQGPWPQRLRSLAHGMRRQLLAYPGFADLIMTRSNHGPGGLRLAETILDILTAAGLGDDEVARFYLVFVDIVLGRSHREAHGDPTSPARNQALLDAASSRADLPRLRALSERLRAADPDQVFESELDMLVAAIGTAAGVTGPAG